MKIGGQNYKINFVDEMKVEGGSIMGVHNCRDCTISIDKELTQSRKKETLIHEILHAIVYQWGIELDDKEEEKICNTLANGLTTVYVDNPWLLPYIQKQLKGDK